LIKNTEKWKMVQVVCDSESHHLIKNTEKWKMVQVVFVKVKAII
jgi:flagellar assembly factor FliW